MICPACDGALHARSAGAVEVDACLTGCGGVWFDAFELKRVAELSEANLEALMALAPSASQPTPRARHDRRPCPRCMGVFLQRHFFSRGQKVQVDTCPQCGGIWLDAGELGAVRDELAAETARHNDRHDRLQRMAQQALNPSEPPTPLE